MVNVYNIYLDEFTRITEMYNRLFIGVGTGGARGALAPSLSRERGGGGRRSPPPHFWGRTYLKIPPRFLFFHPHNSTVLTPNQSVRCFETFIGVGTGGAGDPAPPVFLQCVCGGGGWPLMLEAPSGQFFSVQRYNILHNQ